MLARFERARDDVSLSEAEAREMLKEDGVDVDAEFKLLLEGVTRRHQTERKQELVDAENAYRALDACGRTTTTRSRNDNLARIRGHQERNPELTASFRELTHMSDDDLQTLADELDELTGNGEEE
jgi:hypothetical protein